MCPTDTAGLFRVKTSNNCGDKVSGDSDIILIFQIHYFNLLFISISFKRLNYKRLVFGGSVTSPIVNPATVISIDALRRRCLM